jgi:hypothetical protein
MPPDVFEQLSKALEKKSPVEIDGRLYPVWIMDVRSPREPGSLHSLVVVGAKDSSRTYTGELHVGHDRLAETDLIVDAAIDTIRKIVRGQLPPGTNELL